MIRVNLMEYPLTECRENGPGLGYYLEVATRGLRDFMFYGTILTSCGIIMAKLAGLL